MCGFILAIDPNGKIKPEVSSALKALSHRGPDFMREIYLQKRSVYMGHTRLSIIDLNSAASQPFESKCQRWVIVFNGEIFNYKKIRGEIGSRWQWHTNSDTEVLMAAWAIWGEESLNKLNGMFAFAIMDKLKNTVSIVRDRFGIKPLYTAVIDGGFYFSSEIPPLLKIAGTSQPNLDVIRTYLEDGLYDHSSQTFFNGIESVGPGEIMIIDMHDYSFSKKKWYVLSKRINQMNGIDEGDYIDAVEALIEQSIAEGLVADVPLGLNISGGVDSSLLLDAVSKKNANIESFTQIYAGYSEEIYVRQIANRRPVNLNLCNLTFDDIDRQLMEVMQIQAEPYGGVTVCGYNSTYKKAKDLGIKVVLDGNGLDESFLGYQKYSIEYERGLSNTWQDKKSLRPYQSSLKNLAIDGSASSIPKIIGKTLQAEARSIGIDPGLYEFECPVKRMAAIDLLSTKIPRGLRFNDRISMANSIELRVPFLDQRLVEFGFSMPLKMLINEGNTKNILRKIVQKHYGRDIAYSMKRSVQSPQREWIGKEWRARVEKAISSEELIDRGWIDPKVANFEWQRYLSGSNKNSFPFWQIISLEIWSKIFL
jgi:asparagine synthase (glutamine-hydrolysing)